MPLLEMPGKISVGFPDTSNAKCRRTGCSAGTVEAEIGKLDMLRALVKLHREAMHHSNSCDCSRCGYFEVGISHLHEIRRLCSGATFPQATHLRTAELRYTFLRATSRVWQAIVVLPLRDEDCTLQ
mgnify:CR=1 FL=1